MKNRSLSSKIVLSSFVIILLCALVVGAASIVLFRNESIAMHAREAMSIADSVGSVIDGDQFRTIMETGETNEYYDLVKGFVDQVITRTDLAYLYVLDSAYDESCTYFIEGIALDSDDDVMELGDRESAQVYADELFETLRTGMATTTRIYHSQGFGDMVSAFVPVKDSTGQVVGVIGVDLHADRVGAVTRGFVLQLIPIVLLVLLVVGFLVRRFIRRSLGAPISRLTQASNRLAQGNMDIRLAVDSTDEIGELARAFQTMVESTKAQVEVLGAVARGDLTMEITPRSGQDSMGTAILDTLENLNSMFGEILEMVGSVSGGAQQIAMGAQQLAVGSTQQAQSVEELSAAVEEINLKTGRNAREAGEAAVLSQETLEKTREGTARMERMTQAVREIDRSSQSIGKVIKAIEDIAFQTNLLALNASVEAARAGQQGRGFAVVANEVRSLAAKSAQAARETGALISDTIEKARLGAGISREAAACMAEIGESVEQSYRLMRHIAASAEEQSAAIQEINQGLGQVSVVIQQNSATAEQSAAASGELESLARSLGGLVGRFRLARRHTANPSGTGVSLDCRRAG